MAPVTMAVPWPFWSRGAFTSGADGLASAGASAGVGASAGCCGVGGCSVALTLTRDGSVRLGLAGAATLRTLLEGRITGVRQIIVYILCNDM